MSRQLVLLGLVLVGLVAAANAEDRRTNPSRLVIMTFNALFMWDGVEPEEGNVDIPWKHSQTEAEEHMADVAEVIIQSNPDIVNLVEIENLNALTTLNNKFLAGRGYKPYFTQGGDTTTGQDLGVLTRIDPEGDKIERDNRLGHSGSVAKSVSKNYSAKFAIGDKKLALVGLHFLAKPNDDSRRLPRQAQADVIGRRAKELADEGYAVIVLGDFNDYDGDVPDHLGSDPITNVLQTVKRMNPGTADDDLFNIAELLPQASRYTAFWDRDEDGRVSHPHEHTSIDHLLISPSLRPMVSSADIPHTLDPTEVSDHYPIVLQLHLDGGLPPPPASGEPRLLITRLLPNPPGNENENEEATIKNVGTAPVDLHGFTLRDLARKTWQLDSLGTLAPDIEQTIKRNGQPMAMNNGGDTIEIVDGTGRVLDSLTYDAVGEGEEVER